MFQDIILSLFKSDPSKADEPRDPEAQDSQTAADLLLAAQQRMKQRKDLPKDRCCYYNCQNLEMLLHKLFCCCRTNRYGQSMRQGRRQIERELNLFHFLKQQRRVKATLNAITTYEQRRLIKQQVKAGLYV